ncbi:MAG: hypothetical protein NTY97_00195 [Planctomycetota bacterium]|nr:hypothetical protein [Planctomycetota bacterium]
MKQFVNQACVFALAALAPLALVSTASAGFTNRSASSGVMTMFGGWYLPGEGSSQDLATGVLPTDWDNSNAGWNLEQGAEWFRPRLIFNSWQENGVSAWSRGGYFGSAGTQAIHWSVESLALSFSVTTDDTLEIMTQNGNGAFQARFQFEQYPTVWTTIESWSNLNGSLVVDLMAGTNYRFELANASGTTDDSIFEMHLTGSGAPAPGALALIGMAGIFGGRRRR